MHGWLKDHDPFLERVDLAERETDPHVIQRILVVAARRGVAALTFPAVPEVFEVRLGVTRGPRGVAPVVQLPKRLARMSWAAGVRVNICFPVDADFIGARCQVSATVENRFLLEAPDALLIIRSASQQRRAVPEGMSVYARFRLPGEREWTLRITTLGTCGCGGLLPPGPTRRTGAALAPLELVLDGQRHTLAGRLSSLMEMDDRQRSIWVDFENVSPETTGALQHFLAEQLGHPTPAAASPAREARTA